MVRNGVVSHPSDCSFCGYNEILVPHRKCRLIAYEKLAQLAGMENYGSFRELYKELLEETLRNGKNVREPQWTQSIAVGSESFIESIKEKLGTIAKGRKVIESGKAFQLREEQSPYNAVSGSKKEDIGGENTYFLGVSGEFSIA